MTEEERKLYMIEYRQKNKEKLKQYRENNKEYFQEYYKSTTSPESRKEMWEKQKDKPSVKQKSRDHHLKTMYGITQDEYNQMFEKQEGCCAICNKHQSEVSRALSVDHNHSNGKVRGLLCHTCNSAIGKFYDNVSLLENAITYLKNNIY
jgi:hypothetical protein